MVPHRDSVIRIGGFTAANAEGEDRDLHSQATVTRFDLKTNQWSDLTPLPEPRSSLGATIVGDRIFVIGGWSLSGEKSDWHQTAWSLNVADATADWEPIKAPPFQRRAVWVAEHQGQVYVVGGMDKNSGPTAATDIYNVTTNQWVKGPDLVGDAMTGFGCAAHSLGGRLYVSTVSGNVQRLSEDGTKWEIVGTLNPGRFFHCMLPAADDSLLLVGGANMSVGKFTELEILEIE